MTKHRMAGYFSQIGINIQPNFWGAVQAALHMYVCTCVNFTGLVLVSCVDWRKLPSSRGLRNLVY